jgi:hypothetical protein
MECVASWEGEGQEGGTWYVSYERDYADPPDAAGETTTQVGGPERPTAWHEVWKVAGPSVARRFAGPDEAFRFLLGRGDGVYGRLTPMPVCAAPFPGGLDGPEPTRLPGTPSEGRPEDRFRFG